MATKRTFKKKHLLSVLIFLFFLTTLPLFLPLIKQVQTYLSQALGKPANIIIDPSVDLGPLPQHWRVLAQGGEEKENMLSPVTPQTKALNPQYIRLDHLYDLYEVVKKENGHLKFDWQKLDKVVDDVLATGATPFFSLSYMPPAIAKDGEITNPPASWLEWSLVVQKTIQHYSGKNERNLQNVIYEVWNEPDLFGGWKIGGEKDYRLLYQYAAEGASQAQNTNHFQLGGPATTAPYKAWLDGFLNYVFDRQIRLDFYSWHRYSLKPQEFIDDVDRIDSWLRSQGGYHLLPKFLTEWGSDPENSPYHDSAFDAAHLVATSRQLLQRVDLAFVFEIKDGPSPEGKKYWGRWGLLTHDGEKKPKYHALQLLNKMEGKRINLDGEGTWVKGFATQNKDQINLILANLDSQDNHYERVPVTFVNLENGQYTYEESSLAGGPKVSTETVTTGELKKQLSMTPNSVIYIKLTKIP